MALRDNTQQVVGFSPWRRQAGLLVPVVPVVQGLGCQVLHCLLVLDPQQQHL